MKLLLDEGLPTTAAKLLREMDIDAVHVTEIGYSETEDFQILLKSRDDGRTVVTLDSDFHAMLALTGATSPSVIRIRVEGLSGLATAELIWKVLEQCAEDLERGAVVTVQAGRMRKRRLPLRA